MDMVYAVDSSAGFGFEKELVEGRVYLFRDASDPEPWGFNNRLDIIELFNNGFHPGEIPTIIEQDFKGVCFKRYLPSR